MNLKVPITYPLYDTTYGSEVPTEQVYIYNFEKLPSKYYDMKYNYSPTILDEIKSMGFYEGNRIYINNRRHDSSSQHVFIHTEKEIIILIKTNTMDKSLNDLFQLEFVYNIENGELENQIDMDKIKTFVRPKKKANIHLVKSDMGHLDTEEYDVVIPPVNLKLNYGSEFSKIHDLIVNRLNKNNDKGIILLHGDPGTGKTSYIKYLTSLVKEKDILFIPPSMAEMLSEPTIIPFLMDHKNSILIIEDAERVISDREGNGSPAGVSNILNLTDGILGDCLNIQVIATFNMKREKIDQALLRKGRLICEHKFEKLSVEETNKLLKSLGKKQVVEEGMVLADIYNIDVDVYKTTNKTNKIGFKN
jgi:hypothetical protein